MVTLEPLCAAEPDLFFPPGNDWGEEIQHRDQIQEAKAMCARCPLLERCGEWALSMDPPDKFAIIAGTLPEERARMRRNEARQTRARTA